ncbi:MAG: DNA mismatch repair endonuclease MutL [Chitinivibrionales bacterium]|nr:DNA mismatch repair endonuclease MutL [Chitinivibrionales bacterium]
MITALDDRIEILPRSLADKIAAGEVIERPSSVIKELVENALDANATRITVDVDDAGFASIRVADNGHGMNRADLEKAVLRHATSKIHSLDDLAALHTLGFRGEALASIVAVSRSEVVSCPDDNGLGHRLGAEGSELSALEPVARARGTTITVRDLFYNTPARKKFMKTRRAERMSVVRLFEQLITPFPAIHFVLTIDGQTAVDAPPVSTVRERISQYAGVDFAAELMECSGEIDAVQVSVLLGSPRHAGARPRFQDLYVNLRRVDNDAVTFAMRNACTPFYPGGARPAFFCFVDIDPYQVDVNIHPTKQQVKFDNERLLAGGIHRLVERQLRDLLAPSPTTAQHTPAAPHGEYHEPVPDAPIHQDDQQTLMFPPAVSTPMHVERTREDPPPAGDHERDHGSWDLISCYQIHNLFILAPIKNGIILVDQHAAHERVLFEQALDDLRRGSTTSQQLLFPIVLEFSAAEKPVLSASRESFAALGFDIQDFGGNAVSISAIPAFLRDSQVEEAVRDMVGYLLDETAVRHFSRPEERYAAAFACGSAIKAGQELTREEMSALLNSLFATRNPYTCPHGRPTVTRMSLEELRRRFMR